EAVNASLDTYCSKNQAVHDFMKASELLMQRNAADLEKLRELFEKYGYKPHEEVNNESMSVQNKSDEEKAKDALHLPTSAEKPLLPKNPLCNPQLSDFGLSQYAFSRPWSAVKTQQTTNSRQQKSKIETPLKLRTPRTLPKTPKCRLKMDDYECVTPKLEHFGISEHTMCMNEDYTISLMHKTAQTMKNQLKLYRHFRICRSIESLDLKIKLELVIFICVCVYIFIYILLLIAAADWMASPMGLRFCTPDVKASSKTNSKVLSRSPKTKKLPLPRLAVTPQRLDFQAGSPEKKELPLPSHTVTPKHPDFQTRSPEKKELPLPSHSATPEFPDFQTRTPEKKELPLPSHTATPEFPDFQTRWLKPESKVVNSSCVHFHTLGHKQFLKCQTGSVTKNGAKDKQYKEDSIPFAVSSDEYLKHLGDPSPPTINHYDQLLDTPPPPEITRIPDDVLQILSKYNHKVDFSKAKEMETKAGNTTRYESDSTDYHNKENR
ncbi:SKA3 protein, partial [Formicarius rufipectus]|nr:SKA3 protein [Formicarius rufipectus]